MAGCGSAASQDSSAKWLHAPLGLPHTHRHKHTRKTWNNTSSPYNALELRSAKNYLRNNHKNHLIFSAYSGETAAQFTLTHTQTATRTYRHTQTGTRMCLHLLQFNNFMRVNILVKYTPCICLLLYISRIRLLSLRLYLSATLPLSLSRFLPLFLHLSLSSFPSYAASVACASTFCLTFNSFHFCGSYCTSGSTSSTLPFRYILAAAHLKLFLHAAPCCAVVQQGVARVFCGYFYCISFLCTYNDNFSSFSAFFFFCCCSCCAVARLQGHEKRTLTITRDNVQQGADSRDFIQHFMTVNSEQRLSGIRAASCAR